MDDEPESGRHTPGEPGDGTTEDATGCTLGGDTFEDEPEAPEDTAEEPDNAAAERATGCTSGEHANGGPARPGNADKRDEGATGATGEPTLRESSNTCRSAAGTASVAGETGSGSEDGISEATGPAGAATDGGSTATGLSSRACAAGSRTVADDSSKHEPESGNRPLTGPSDRGAGSAWTGSQASVADGCANAGNGLRGGSANWSRSTPARTT